MYHWSACRIVRRSRLWIPLCLRSLRRICSLLHRNPCKIVRRFKLSVSLHLRSWRTACRSYHRSACKIVRRSRLWVSSCLRSWRTACPSYHRSATKIVRQCILRIPLCHSSWRHPWSGFPCASVHGGSHGSCAAYTTEERAELRWGTDCGFRASGHGCSPVPLITEIMADVLGLPQERVQHRATYIGKVFTVEMLHQHVRANPGDSVVFNIKGLDEHNLPRSGDVMVPPPQITKVSWFDSKSQVAADGPWYRCQPKRPGRSSRSKLKH